MSHEVLIVERAVGAARAARRWVRHQAAAVIDDDRRLDDIELATSELVENAVEHGGGRTLAVHVETSDGDVVVAVVSTSEVDAVRDALAGGRDPVAPNSPSGRGLSIVASVSDAVRVTSEPPTTTVTCRFAAR